MKAPGGISPEAQAFYDLEPPPLDQFDLSTEEGARTLRAGLDEQAQAAFEELVRKHGVSQAEVGGVPGCWMAKTESNNSNGAILYFHGGGYVVGSAAFSAPLTMALAKATGVPAFSAEYRLAPEHPFPAAREDTLATYQGLLDQGIAAQSMAVCGDSAGGGLALGLLIELRDRGIPLPGACGLVSPWVDLTGAGESVHGKAHEDPLFVKAEHLFQFVPVYAGDEPPEDPRLSPLFADLAGLPPLCIQVGSQEILLSDSTRLAEAAEAAEVQVSLEVWDGMWHVFQGIPDVPEAGRAISSMADFLKKYLSLAN